jgi:hypothetical protein
MHYLEQLGIMSIRISLSCLASKLNVLTSSQLKCVGCLECPQFCLHRYKSQIASRLLLLLLKLLGVLGMLETIIRLNKQVSVLHTSLSPSSSLLM